jgi:tetrahydromethanopterin S-methyltransferase subunit E
MESLSAALAVLSAMITPAVLILACSSLLVATSTRLGRVVDRTRKLSERFEEMSLEDSTAPEDLAAERLRLVFDQLNKAASRARLLQRAMTRLYLGLSVFLATSVAIGIDAATGWNYAWPAVLLGLVGVGLLFYASVLLIVESRVALAAIDSEMDFVRRLAATHAPAELLQRPRRRRRLFRKPKG